MTKIVGVFEGDVSSGGYPVWCQIKDGRFNEIVFDHRCLPDLEHLVKEMRRIARQRLPSNNKEEV